jgi:beta-N-acetylhexosaminidase
LSDPNRRAPRAAIVDVTGTVLSDAERALFEAYPPYAFILFRRNCESPEGVRALIASLRACVGRDDAPILIDQEGGRVQRLSPPLWRGAPSAAHFGRLYQIDPEAGLEATRLNARLIASDLVDLGVSVNCAPVLDLALPGAHNVIGDRAFGGDPEMVANLADAFAEGLREGGVIPVIKHIPGHGRAMVDSHYDCPIVHASSADLRAKDFLPFQKFTGRGGDRAWAMTAHIVYEALDTAHPATTSAAVIGNFVRGEIGFDGVLLSDDLSMQALGGGAAERCVAALDAGCDFALHCNGTLEERTALLTSVPAVSPDTLVRLARCGQTMPPPVSFDRAAAVTRLDLLLSAA